MSNVEVQQVQGNPFQNPWNWNLKCEARFSSDYQTPPTAPRCPRVQPEKIHSSKFLATEKKLEKEYALWSKPTSELLIQSRTDCLASIYDFWLHRRRRPRAYLQKVRPLIEAKRTSFRIENRPISSQTLMEKVVLKSAKHLTSAIGVLTMFTFGARRVR